jgi:L-fucose isomerase-like protein
MEILSYLKQQGRTGEIIHGDPEQIAHRVEVLTRVLSARRSLKGVRLGVIGEPSDWLIASAPDEVALQQKLGISLVRIPIAELIAKLEGISRDRQKGAEEIYLALKDMVAQYNLQGLTLRCFDLLGPICNTGCLALAKLNAEGIPASCEGDIPALVTMVVGNALTGQCGFQANPARIDPAAGEYLFAHCTVPLNMVRSYEYDTHFESGLGVAIRGVLPEGNATIFKLSGDLSRSFVAPMQLLRNQAEPGLCRTQVVLKADGCAEYFLRGPIGNHHIIFCGNYAEVFKEFMEKIG